MTPLITNRRILAAVYLYPVNDVIWMKIFYAIFGSMAFGLIVCIVVMSAIFIMKFASNDLEASLFALLQIFACSAIAYEYICAFCVRHKLAALFDQLTDIYKMHENKCTFYILTKTNKFCEWMWQFYFKYAMGALFIASSAICAASVIYCQFKKGAFDTKYLYHPQKLAFPWDVSTPLGYFGEICIHISCCEAYFIINGPILLLFISICLHHQAFHDIFRFSLNQLSHRDNSRNDKRFLCELIRFHITIKDWFLESAQVYSLIVLIQLICSTLLLACTIFQMDLRLKHIDYDVCFILEAAGTGASNLFLFCFYGYLATESFGKTANCFYESNWQSLLIELQKYILLSIRNMQKPIFYHGFGLVTLNLETFFKMLRVVFSYYMMFKTITNE